MKTLMRNGRDRRSENPLGATRGKSACFWLGPISGSHQGQQPQRLHSKAGYMAAPERFAKSQILFPCTAGAVHTWHDSAVRKPALHVDAAAQAANLAIGCGRAGIYNIADDEGIVSIVKACVDLGFDPEFRLRQ